MMVLADSMQNASPNVVGGVPQGHTFAGLDFMDAKIGKRRTDYLNLSGEDPDAVINPGPNADFMSSNLAFNLRWRHTTDTSANFVWADGHATSQKIGTVLKRNIYPVAP